MTQRNSLCEQPICSFRDVLCVTFIYTLDGGIFVNNFWDK